MRISDWSSDVCSSDLHQRPLRRGREPRPAPRAPARGARMTTADMQPDQLEDAPRGEQFYQGLLDDEIRPVPVSLRATSRGFTGSGGIERSRYFDPEFHRREMEGVWSRVWQMACRGEQNPNVGDSIVYEIGDWSLIVVRTAPDEIRALDRKSVV